MNPIILKRSVHHIPVLEVVLKELREERIPVVIYYHGWQTSKELVLTQGRKIQKTGNATENITNKQYQKEKNA